MNHGKKLQALLVLATLGISSILTGCKSAPELTATEAQSLIQANYDQTTPVGASITVNDLGMRQGITAKYWTRTKEYPNHYWADFTLTDDGKKVVKLPNGGDVIQWHPLNANDPHYSILVVTVTANHLKAHDINNIQDEVVPGVETAKGAGYTEGVNLDGVPGPLQDIAHNPGNQLSRKRHADFSLDAGAWKLHSIE
ncbi:MAG: hypothetical protein ABSG51_05870 [Terracidiphilus sp.]|jgi:hypothetical protein